MIIVIICAIIGSFIGIHNYNANDYWGDDDSPFWGFGVGLVIGIIIAFFIGTSGNVIKPDVARSNLRALNDGTSVSGQFFIGIGTIDGKQVYNYYKEVGKDQYKLSRIDANPDNDIYDVIVKEEEIKQPFVETLGSSNHSNVSGWVGFNIHRNYTLDHVVFHVPKGSIKTGVQLDAQ